MEKKSLRKILQNVKRKNRGITLIALVITIVIIVILSTITINFAFGENGLIRGAESARDFYTNDTKYTEESISNVESYIDGIINGEEIDWEQAMADAKAPDSQEEERNEGVIGLGTDGKPVDMDLWEYAYDETTNGYALNSEETLNNSDYGGNNVEMVLTSGYLGKITGDGRIEGTVPAYISMDNGKTYRPVTSLYRTFQANCENNKNLINLRIAPIIPETTISMLKTFVSASNLENMPVIPESVTNMESTFIYCSNLTDVTNIPENVLTLNRTFSNCTRMEYAPKINSKDLTDMTATFENCTSLMTSPTIPNSVTNMNWTFDECTSLTNAPKIPNGVENMYQTFLNCTSLKTAPTIPNSVTVLVATFRGCSNLQGIIEINANVTGARLGEEFYNNIDYANCLLEATTNPEITLKVTGSCTVLQEIISNANNPNIIMENNV